MIGAWLTVVLAAPNPAPAERPTVLVAPIQAIGEVAANDAQMLSELVRTFAGKSTSYSLVTPEELAAVDKELVRQLSGACNDDTCMTELGGALGAQLIITGTLGRIKGRYTLILKLVEISTVTARNVVRRRSREIADFEDALPLLVAELLGDLRVGPGVTRQRRRPSLSTEARALIGLGAMGLGATGLVVGIFNVVQGERTMGKAVLADTLILSAVGLGIWVDIERRRAD
jgi:hypothetical protein